MSMSQEKTIPLTRFFAMCNWKNFPFKKSKFRYVIYIEYVFKNNQHFVKMYKYSLYSKCMQFENVGLNSNIEGTYETSGFAKYHIQNNTSRTWA